jgi:hypothetical protein
MKKQKKSDSVDQLIRNLQSHGQEANDQERSGHQGPNDEPEFQEEVAAQEEVKPTIVFIDVFDPEVAQALGFKA